MGQHGGHKGIDTLLAALPELLQECPSSAWLVIGGARTPHTDELERLVAALPGEARARCRLLTDLAPQEKADLLGDCDVFASPSEKEAFGLTTLEAWALRKPVVVGDSPSQACIVDDGESGVIVPYGDVARLRDALVRLGRDRALRAAMGRPATRGCWPTTSAATSSAGTQSSWRRPPTRTCLPTTGPESGGLTPTQRPRNGGRAGTSEGPASWEQCESPATSRRRAVVVASDAGIVHAACRSP